METSVAHRKIELQSAEDFSYLIANVRRAAAAHINDAFPPVPSVTPDAQSGDPGDELRRQIETLVDEYIARTFALAAPNLTVNGLPVEDPSAFLGGDGDGNGERKGEDEKRDAPEELHEPFDGRKRERVLALAGQEEDLLREIAALKRKVPGAAAAGWAERVRAGIEADERLLEERRGEVARSVGEEDGRRDGEESRGKKGKGWLGDVGPLERQEDVERAFGTAVSTLGRLKADMPATVARMERARVAGEYVVPER